MLESWVSLAFLVSPCLKPEKSKFRANFAHLHQPYQDVWTFVDWEPRVFPETDRVITKTIFFSQFIVVHFSCSVVF